MTAFNLKIIALAAMLIDHMGYAVPQVFGLPPGINLFRIIGRVAFPIFAYLIAEGFRHTKNNGAFLLRLGIFAIISEVPFDLVFNRDKDFFAHTNIFYTLFLAGAAITVCKEIFKKIPKDKRTLNIFAYVVCLAVACSFVFLARFLSTDYGAIGVLFIFSMYAIKEKKLRLFVMAFFCVAIWHNIVYSILTGAPVSNSEIFLIAATLIPVILFIFYNGKRGLSLKWLFYIFYPVHLLILAALK